MRNGQHDRPGEQHGERICIRYGNTFHNFYRERYDYVYGLKDLYRDCQRHGICIRVKDRDRFRMLYRDWATVSDRQWDGEWIALRVDKQNRLHNYFWKRRRISFCNDSQQ